MKKIENEYFKKFCDDIKRSLFDPSKFDDCLTDIITASEGDTNHVYVSSNNEHNMEIIKFDEYTKDFNNKRRNEITELKDSHIPSLVDAVCVNKNNEWFLIEFKDEPLKNVLRSTPKKC